MVSFSVKPFIRFVTVLSRFLLVEMLVLLSHEIRHGFDKKMRVEVLHLFSNRSTFCGVVLLEENGHELSSR